MKRLLAFAVALLLSSLAQAQTPSVKYMNALGSAAPASSTDQFSVCQQSGGCGTGNALTRMTLAQLLTYIQANVNGSGVGVQGGQSVASIGDDNTALASGHYVYVTNAVYTANRIKALPDSATQGAGDIAVIDAFQGLSSHSLTLCAAGSNTVNGGSAGGCAPALTNIGGGIGLHNDGAGNWTVTWNTLLGTSTAPTHQFATGLTTSGLAYSQPAFTDLTGTSNVGQLSVPAEWTALQTFDNVSGKTTTDATTSHPLAAGDCGQTVRFTSSSAISVTTTATLPVGCVIAIEQAGAGQITVSAGAGSSFNSAFNYTKTRTQWSLIGLRVDVNVGGTAAHYLFVGDGA